MFWGSFVCWIVVGAGWPSHTIRSAADLRRSAAPPLSDLVHSPLLAFFTQYSHLRSEEGFVWIIAVSRTSSVQPPPGSANVANTMNTTNTEARRRQEYEGLLTSSDCHPEVIERRALNFACTINGIHANIYKKKQCRLRSFAF